MFCVFSALNHKKKKEEREKKKKEGTIPTKKKNMRIKLERRTHTHTKKKKNDVKRVAGEGEGGQAGGRRTIDTAEELLKNINKKKKKILSSPERQRV